MNGHTALIYQGGQNPAYRPTDAFFYSRLLATLGRCDARRISAEAQSGPSWFFTHANSLCSYAALARRVGAEGRWP